MARWRRTLPMTEGGGGGRPTTGGGADRLCACEDKKERRKEKWRTQRGSNVCLGRIFLFFVKIKLIPEDWELETSHKWWCSSS